MSEQITNLHCHCCAEPWAGPLSSGRRSPGRTGTTSLPWHCYLSPKPSTAEGVVLDQGEVPGHQTPELIDNPLDGQGLSFHHGILLLRGAQLADKQDQVLLPVEALREDGI